MLALTSLKRRLENVLVELAIIREAINNFKHYPPCCLKIYDDGKISCDVIGPLPKNEFLEECSKCREWIKKTLSKIKIEETDF